jgi:hypothetical protein
MLCFSSINIQSTNDIVHMVKKLLCTNNNTRSETQESVSILAQYDVF